VTAGGDGEARAGVAAAGVTAEAGAEGEDKPVKTERTRMEPPVGAESGPFWEATRNGTLLVQWCTSCDRGIFYPRFFCPYCAVDGPDNSAADQSDQSDQSGQSGPSGGSTLEWRTASGRAIVHAATVEHNPAATGATFSHGEPYVVALVDLDEGVRMMTNIVGCAPEDVRPGMTVTVTWEPLSDGRQLPLFTPAAKPA
jgi:uncharacterized OB-fold protein